VNTPATQSGNRSAARLLAVIAIALIVGIYTAAVVAGGIPKARHIDSVHLTMILAALLACVVILRPQAVDRVGRLEAFGFRIELLQRLQERQVQQGEQLSDVDLLIPLLFRDTERKHVSNLVRGTTKGYRGGAAVRDELRRLRSIGLLRTLPDRHVSNLHSDTVFDLADWVALTDFGRRWAERLRRVDEVATETAEPNDR
jgi:hypothetical protein